MKRIRCAIYTRKSTEDGLEQDFNSLDAQREACEAYIASQKHEGWELLPDHFDDGGISGGHLERPALQRLMEAVDSKQVDQIVVYKIDRLTRSLADFAKLVDRLDQAEASFVSVTQSFNTATSMGRLTLNVLLSFAQFEREVTAERIRDKIAASKRKGLWMGGNVPLGYDPDGRSLSINQDEAETVLTLYGLYEEWGIMSLVQEAAGRLQLTSKLRRAPDGSLRGGKIMSRGQLHHILTNPIYAGRNVPPRTLKSIIISVAWPAYLLGHDPSLQIWVVSNNLDLATELANKFRKIVDSDWYKSAFPTMSGAPEKDNERVFVTNQGGSREAISVNGAVIWKGADNIIVDDPIDAAQVASQLVCDKVNHWIDTSLSSRLNNPATSKMVLVMQRLSIYDPAAHLASQESWSRLSLPAIAEEDMQVPIGKEDFHMFNQGDLLDPIRLPKKFLELQRAKMGEPNFLAQYQQRPVPDGGGEIDISLFRRYDALPKPYDVRFLSVDAASGKQSGSYSVIQAFQMTDERLYMLWSSRGYWDFYTLRDNVMKARTHFKADFIAVEKAHTGEALLEVLWDEYPTDVRRKLIQPIRPRLSKEDRMAKAMVLVSDGRVFLPKEAPWLEVFVPELAEFPGGKNDDQVDALSQGISFFNTLLKSRYNPHYDRSVKVLTTW